MAILTASERARLLGAAAVLLSAGCYGDDFTKVDAPGGGSGGGGGAGGGAPVDPCLGVKLPAPTSCKVATTPTNGCGADGKGDCCVPLCVPGGTFKRGYDGFTPYTDPNNPATVRTFALDKYEVTVGRVRAWLKAAGSSQPAPSAGAPPGFEAKVGWDSSWPLRNKNEIVATLDGESSELRTWKTPYLADDKALPISDLNWYEAQAFCIWEGGRLPTEAEWNYAAAGGSEQRVFPWSVPAANQLINDSNTGYGCPHGNTGDNNCIKSPGYLHPAGAKLATGDGAKWGHADMAGNVEEWVLDFKQWIDNNEMPLKDAKWLSPCDNCVDPNGGKYRAARGGAFDESSNEVRTNWHYSYDAEHYQVVLGFRCAYDLKTP